jgi:hypothetical protein
VQFALVKAMQPEEMTVESVKAQVSGPRVGVPPLSNFAPSLFTERTVVHAPSTRYRRDREDSSSLRRL